MKKRLILHPIFGNFRSLSIFFCNVIAVAVTVGVLGRHFLKTAESVGVNPRLFPSGPNYLASLLLSPYVHVLIAGLSILIGTGVTAMYVVGPIRRIEQWLNDWENGRLVRPFRSRIGDDTYKNVVNVMNSLHDKSKKKTSTRA